MLIVMSCSALGVSIRLVIQPSVEMLDYTPDGAYRVFSSVIRVRLEEDTATSKETTTGSVGIQRKNSLKIRFSSGYWASGRWLPASRFSKVTQNSLPPLRGQRKRLAQDSPQPLLAYKSDAAILIWGSGVFTNTKMRTSENLDLVMSCPSMPPPPNSE